MTFLETLTATLRQDEGRRLVAYLDGEGVWTIGYGHTAGVRAGDTCTTAQAEQWLVNDIQIAISSLNVHAAWWQNLPEQARQGLAQMSYNLGWPRLSCFKKMLAALQAGDFETAADEALDSKWHKQVGQRADRIAALFRSCATVGEA